MKTVDQLRTEIWAQMFPSGQPENLKISPVAGVRSAHDGHLQEAFSEVAKWCRCEQSEVVNVIEFCNTSFRCGMTIVPAPRGHIRRVFTVVGDDFCDPVEYRPVVWPQPECLGRKVLANVGMLPAVPDLPLGFSKADAATDCVNGRARAGVWSIWQGNIYLFPWIQSTEKVVIEWDGIKSEWGDLDIVNPDQDYRQCVKLWAQFAHERDFGEQGEAGKFKGLFDVQLGDLIWECAQRNKLPANPQMCLPEPCARLLCGQFEQTGVATVASLVLAQIGAYGDDTTGGANEALVAQLVGSFAPAAVLAPAPRAIADYDLYVGKFYEQYISPYGGAFGPGATKNSFYPAPADNDWSDTTLALYKDFFSGLPNNGRYYDVCLGLVHIFVLSTDEDSEADVLVLGSQSPASVEGLWLKAKMMLSPARWKIVVLAEPPYLTSGGSGGAATNMQWPFKDWGADLVISAFPRYERWLVDGLMYVNNGMGGKPIGTTPTAAQGLVLDQTHFGAGKLTVASGSLQYDFIDVGGVVRDTFTLTK